MRKHLLATMTFFMGKAFAAELTPDPEHILAQAMQLVEFADEEIQAREKLLEECDKKAQQLTTFIAVSRMPIINNKIKNLKEIYGSRVTDEILALQKELSELSVTPELNFLSRFNYVIEKKRYEDQRLSTGDRKAKYFLQFRYLQDVIRLNAEYERVKDTDLIRTQCSAFHEMIPQLLEEAKRDFLGEAMAYLITKREEFCETHKVLEAQKNETPSSKELEEIFAEVDYSRIGYEVSELLKENPIQKDKIVTLQKELSELPVASREKKFVARASYS